MKKIRCMRTLCLVLMLVMFTALGLGGCANKQNENLYAQVENWAYLEMDTSEKTADVFFICPTVYSGDDNTFNMALDDAKTKESFLGATNMEKGIYDTDCRFFAPYYRQAALNVFEMERAEREQYLSIAYEDVKQAFEYYLENYNNGRPIVLAGFSQGADLSIRLLKDCFAEQEVNNLLVACYAIGWCITEEELEEYAHLQVAQSETDIGVIVSFNSEAENVTDSLIIPKGTKTLAINPLNWQTDSTPAEKTLNKGACFTNYSGNIKNEIPELTGAYIDPVRGALKVTDITAEEYPSKLSIFESGVYHLYDYQFFYRNLQENVSVRVTEYIRSHN